MIDWNHVLWQTFLEALKQWRFYLTLSAPLLLIWLYRERRLLIALWTRRKLAALGIQDIDELSGRDFERYLDTLFRRKGYRVKLTPYVKDYGADLIVEKGGVKTVVQAKRYTKNVGIRAVQEAVAAKGKYGCTHAMVVTNSGYTHAATELATANRVELWGRERLMTELLSLQIAPATPPRASLPTPPRSAGFDRSVAASALAQDPADALLLPAPGESAAAVCAICAVCGKALSPKVAAYCRANAARFEGRGLCFEHQKTESQRKPPCSTDPEAT